MTSDIVYPKSYVELIGTFGRIGLFSHAQQLSDLSEIDI